MKRKLYIDPRTKLLLLVTIAMFVMGGIGGSRMLPCTIVLCFIPLILLLIQREWKSSIISLRNKCYRIYASINVIEFQDMS